MAYTTTDLLTQVKRLATAAKASNKTFTNSELFAIADSQLHAYVVPLIKRYKGEYGIFTHDVPITAGKKRYRIPGRAMGDSLRDIKYLDSRGNELQMIQVALDAGYDQTVPEDGCLPAYTLESNYVNLKAVPSDAVKLRFRYFIRPNRLVETNQAGTVVAKVGQVLTISGPLGWTSGTKYDIVKSTPGFEHVLIDLTPSAFLDGGTGTYTFTCAADVDLSDVEVGDYFCRAEESPVPQIPADLHPALYQRIVIRMQELQGDAMARKNAQEEWALYEASLADLLAPRVESARVVLSSYLRDHLL